MGVKTCKGCGIKEYPMWYTEEYCSRSCALNKFRNLRKELKELFNLLKSK